MLIYVEQRNPLNAVSQASQLLQTSFESMEKIRIGLLAQLANLSNGGVSTLLADFEVELQECVDMATSIHLSSRHQAVSSAHPHVTGPDLSVSRS